MFSLFVAEIECLRATNFDFSLFMPQSGIVLCSSSLELLATLGTLGSMQLFVYNSIINTIAATPPTSITRKMLPFTSHRKISTHLDKKSQMMLYFCFSFVPFNLNCPCYVSTVYINSVTISRPFSNLITVEWLDFSKNLIITALQQIHVVLPGMP